MFRTASNTGTLVRGISDAIEQRGSFVAPTARPVSRALSAATCSSLEGVGEQAAQNLPHPRDRASWMYQRGGSSRGFKPATECI